MRFLLIVALFFISVLSPSWAAKNDTSKKGQELNKVKIDIKQINENIEQIKIKRNLLSKQLRNIEKQYGKTAGSLKELKQKIGGKKRRLKEIKTEVKSRHDDLIFQNRELSGQIKAAYIMGKKEKLKLLLNQQDPALASRMMMYYDYLNNARLKKLTAIQNHLKVLALLLEERGQENKLLEQAVELRKTQQVDLANTKKQRKILLSKLNKDFSSKSKQLNILEDNEKQLYDLMLALEVAARKKEAAEKRAVEQLAAEKRANKQQLANVKINNSSQQKTKKPPEIILANKEIAIKSKKMPAYKSTGLPFYKLKGKLPWPIQGKIVKTFGSKRSDTRWDGVLISASEGTNIHAVTDGRVVFADWLRGYGLLVIIDHGKSYMTLYAFNQSLYKKVGDRVKSGTVIASVGKSGGRNKSGLYFGVRRKGKAVNPKKWCRKAQNGNVG